MTPALARLPRIVRSYSTTAVASVASTPVHLHTTLGTLDSIPAHELWLFLNPDVRQQVTRGILDAQLGRISPVESFAEFADIELDV